MRLFLATVLFTLAFPALAFAHASPIEYEPSSGATLREPPAEVRIRFSERLEKDASRIIVRDENGAERQSGKAQVDPADPYVLSVPLAASADGIFTVSWSVVSADDGHFTKGSYAYAAGAAHTVDAQHVPYMEIIHSSARKEATAMAAMLLGNGLLWGAFVFFAFILRRRMSAFDDTRTAVARLFQGTVFAGVALMLAGDGAHVALKAGELAGLHGIAFSEAVPLYLATASGFASLARIAIACAIGAFFALRRGAILAAGRFTVNEIILFALLLVFAYFDAKISHATANPFYPQLSVLVNIFHLMGKALWMGITFMLSTVYLSRTLRPLVGNVWREAMRALAIAFGVVGVTGSYIVWLHLKDFGNVASTLWGERSIFLLGSALLASILLVYHIIAPRIWSQTLGKWLPLTLSGSLASLMLMVGLSALIIITSPPLEGSHAVFREESNGITITLERALYEDGKALLAVSGARGQTLGEPLVRIGGEGGLIVELEKRFEGGYVFPAALLPAEEAEMTIIVPQAGGYDGYATFSMHRAEFGRSEPGGHGRTMDTFTQWMVAIALFAAAAAAMLYACARGNIEPNPNVSFSRYIVGACAGLFAVSQIVGISGIFLGNEFKKECIADRNSWHVMLPMRDGRVVGSVPQEGCMVHDSRGMLHLPDAREYRYLKNR